MVTIIVDQFDPRSCCLIKQNLPAHLQQVIDCGHDDWAEVNR